MVRSETTWRFAARKRSDEASTWRSHFWGSFCEATQTAAALLAVKAPAHRHVILHRDRQIPRRDAYIRAAGGVADLGEGEAASGCGHTRQGYTVFEVQTGILAKHNPIARIDVLAKAKAPVFVIHGGDDLVVHLTQNSAKLAEKYTMADADDVVTLVVVKGQGHNFWKELFQCQELVDLAVKWANERPQPSVPK